MSVFSRSYFFFYAILPLVFSDLLIDPVLVPRQMILSIFLLMQIVFIKVTLRESVSKFNASTFTKLTIYSSWIFLAISFLSLFYAINISEAFYVTIKFGVIIAFLFITFILLKLQLIYVRDLAKGVFVFCLISLILGYYDLWVIFSSNHDVLKYSNFIRSTYANKNLFGSIILLCLWSVFLHRSKAIIIFTTTLILIILTLVQSKIVIAAFSFFIAVLMLRVFVSNYFKKSSGLYIALAFFIIIGILITKNFERFENLSNFHTLDIRMTLWDKSFEMIKENPMGIGAGNWQFVMPKFGLSEFDLQEVQNGSVLFRQPHNDFIWVFCELGVFGFLTYSVFFILIFYMTFRLMTSKIRIAYLIILMSLMSYCFVAFFDFPLERIEHQIILATLVAIILFRHDKTESCNNEFRSIPTILVSVTLLSLISIVICVFRLKGEFYSREMLRLDRKLDAELVIKYSAKAKSLFYTVDPSSMPIDFYEGISLYGTGNLDEAITALERAKAYSPFNINILSNLHIMYKRKGNLQMANELHLQQMKISPYGNIPTVK